MVKLLHQMRIKKDSSLKVKVKVNDNRINQLQRY